MSQYGADAVSEPIAVHEYTKFSGMEIGQGDVMKIHYLALFDHVHKNIISKILWSDDYKKLCIRVLQIFDPDIKDILILKSDITGRNVEYINHRCHGNMPISTGIQCRAGFEKSGNGVGMGILHGRV